MPHVAERAQAALAKTALGAENYVSWQFAAEAVVAVDDYKNRGYTIYALEQTATSSPLFQCRPRFPALLVLGHETAGVSQELLALADEVVEIPMAGRKESLNVSVAAGIALYSFRHPPEP